MSRIVMLSALLVMLALPLAAQVRPGDVYYDDLDDPCWGLTGDRYEACFWSSGWMGTSYSSCTASGSSGCSACGHDQNTGIVVCVNDIHYSASCQCTIDHPAPSYTRTCKGSGKCTYQP